jgi:glycosyltransferase involved in cell wall biosynthesis
VLVRKLYGIPLAVRVKGDRWRELREIELGIPFRAKVKTIINFHAGNLVIRNADALIPLSSVVTDAIKKEMGEEKLTREVALPFRAPTESSIPDDPLAEGDPFVLTVTNFNYWGKVETLVEAIRLMASLVFQKGYRWIVLGEGHFLSRVMNLVEDEIQSGKVLFLGKRSTSSFYRKARAQFYFSGMDTMSNVLLECFYCRLPVLLNQDFPVREIARDGFNVLKVDLRDPTGMDAVLDRILNDEEERQRLVENALQFIGNEWSVEKMADHLDEAMTRLCRV